MNAFLLAGALGLVVAGYAAADPLAPLLVRLEPAPFEHRLDGEWRRDGRTADAPKAVIQIAAPVDIMALPVSVQDFMACVEAGACGAPFGRQDPSDLPVTGVNWLDAMAYAKWVSQTTGQTWRLPSDAEWAQAAGSLFRDDALGVEEDPANPAVRWLAEYEQAAARSRDQDRDLRPVGSLNVNELGVHDIGGAVWEWTSTCLRRVEADQQGVILSQEEACGIYIAEGRHRAALTLFESNPRTGGCSVGTPPDNLGFRLVREVPTSLFGRMTRWLLG